MSPRAQEPGLKKPGWVTHKISVGRWGPKSQGAPKGVGGKRDMAPQHADLEVDERCSSAGEAVVDGEAVSKDFSEDLVRDPVDGGNCTAAGIGLLAV